MYDKVLSSQWIFDRCLELEGNKLFLFIIILSAICAFLTYHVLKKYRVKKYKRMFISAVAFGIGCIIFFYAEVLIGFQYVATTRFGHLSIMRIKLTP